MSRFKNNVILAHLVQSVNDPEQLLRQAGWTSDGSRDDKRRQAAQSPRFRFQDLKRDLRSSISCIANVPPKFLSSQIRPWLHNKPQSTLVFTRIKLVTYSGNRELPCSSYSPMADLRALIAPGLHPHRVHSICASELNGLQIWGR